MNGPLYADDLQHAYKNRAKNEICNKHVLVKIYKRFGKRNNKKSDHK
jgi:hypothetical protein